MRNDEKEKEKDKKKKPYEKPEVTTEELFEATVLACGKIDFCLTSRLS